MKEDWIYKRGDLYYANLNPYFGSEQGGTRPVLVLQNNVGNFFCPTLIVAPLTSTEPKTADTAVTESDESDAAKILELLKNPETAALLKQLAKAL